MILLAQVVQVSVISSSRHVAHVSFSLILFDLPFHFNLSFPVFFLSSVLMHPDLHTDLYNLDSVENNLRHSAKGSLDAYDVTFSLTEPGIPPCTVLWSMPVWLCILCSTMRSGGWLQA